MNFNNLLQLEKEVLLLKDRRIIKKQMNSFLTKNLKIKETKVSKIYTKKKY